MRIGDYVEPIEVFKKDDSERSNIDLSGLVVDINYDYHDIISFISVMSLDDGKITSGIPANYCSRKEVPLKQKEKFLYFKSLIKTKPEFKVVLEEHYGSNVWVNPEMDELRKDSCLCFNCEELDKSCDIAKKFYHLCQENDCALILTRCKKFKGSVK